ncbi:MAG: malto-oligosyltrehalose synthase [Rubrivivax sp.]|nr:malto-oligosyltrehalose synthase [Rubrivivax sp.]
MKDRAGSAPPTTARPARTRVPRATYRVQLHAGFRFADATALVPYLADLGVSHLYCSPVLRARPGSQHGYDVVDHGELNPELGTRDEFDRLVAALHRHGMGLLVDIVPNHMGVLGGDNAWWLDVLENGASSTYANYFDIDWHSPDPALTGKVLLPILGDQYGLVLERGELQLAFDAERGYFTLRYHEHRMPLDPAAYGPLLRRALQTLPAPLGSRAELQAVADGLDRLPAHHGADGQARLRRQADKSALKARLAACLRRQPALVQAIDGVVARINGRPGERASFDTLSALIDAQPYRLAHWRVAGDEINYRRFFDINELAALRMERAEVFEATHRLILELAAAGAIDGLRLDHPDGLADPAGYFSRLQRRYAEVAGLPPPLPGSDGMPPELPLYVVAEKIVAAHEQVPRDWALHGTTGYRFANVVNGLLIDPASKARLDRVWRVFAPDEFEGFDTLSWRCRHVVMDGSLAGELTVLSGTLLRLAREDRRTRDFTLHSLRQALADVVASFPVYRTYIVDKPSRQDRKYIDWAIGRARRRSVAADASVFDFLRQVLLGRPLPGAPAGLAERYRAFAQRLQQYTAPVVAKGIEDTALYRHHRLISVNDVGGEPDDFGISVAAFHAITRERAQHRPSAMLTTSTHDAKRSEDVRARIDVISEMPAAWRLATRRWTRMNRRHKHTVNARLAPTRNDEYLLYQLLVGSLPAGAIDDAGLAEYAARIQQAMLKSVRESKAVSSWMNPNEAYEAALAAFVQALLGRREGNLFLADLQSNAEVIAWYGALNGLTLAVVKTLSPGVPDFYQGHELIGLSLVDPDNRRPIDFAQRRRLIEESRQLLALPDRGAALRELVAHAVDGRAKFWVTWRALQLRREHDAMLRQSEYVPLEVRGTHARHIVAFGRRHGGAWLVVIAARLYASLGCPVGAAPQGVDWADTAVVWPEADAAATNAQVPWLEDAISGRRHALTAGGDTPTAASLPLASVLTEFPVAALFGAWPGPP